MGIGLYSAKFLSLTRRLFLLLMADVGITLHWGVAHYVLYA